MKSSTKRLAYPIYLMQFCYELLFENGIANTQMVFLVIRCSKAINGNVNKFCHNF